MSTYARHPRLHSALLTGSILLTLTGCGAAKAQKVASSATPSEPQYAEPFTHQQLLVEQGARLAVSDGCSACHLMADKTDLGPSFYSFAGHHVTLTDGHSVLVDERFIREGLLHPGGSTLKGYDPAPMIAAVERLHLNDKPAQVSALAAFIEQIGPEPEPES